MTPKADPNTVTPCPACLARDERAAHRMLKGEHDDFDLLLFAAVTLGNCFHYR